MRVLFDFFINIARWAWTEKNVSAVAYSTVYPLAMFLRILSGQFVLLILWQFVS